MACALGYNIASLPTNGRVLMFSMEMPGRDLAARLMALESGVSVKDIRKVNLAGKYEVLASALGKVSDADFWIDESLEPSPLEIRSRVREFVCERGPLGLVIVDYLQLMVNSADENVVNKISEREFTSSRLTGFYSLMTNQIRLNRFLGNRRRLLQLTSSLLLFN